RWVITSVVPLPAPARISRGDPRWDTASSCCGFKRSRKDMHRLFYRGKVQNKRDSSTASKAPAKAIPRERISVRFKRSNMIVRMKIEYPTSRPVAVDVDGTFAGFSWYDGEVVQGDPMSREYDEDVHTLVWFLAGLGVGA